MLWRGKCLPLNVTFIFIVPDPSHPGLLNNKVRHNNVVIQIVLPTLQQPTTAKAQSHHTKHMSIFNAVFSSSTMMTWAICPKKVALGVDCSSANDWGNDWIPHILPNALKHWIIPQLSQPLPHVDHNYQLMWRPADKRPSTRPGSRLDWEVGQLFACWEPMRKICSVCFKRSRPLPYQYWHIDTHRKRRHCLQC